MLEARGAFAEAEPLQRRVLEATERLRGPEHRVTLTAVNNMAVVLERLGKFSEAPLRAASSHGRVAFCGGKRWEKMAGKQSTHFQIISSQKLSSIYKCDKHEHVKAFTQIILNHYKFRHIICLCIFMDISWKCQSLTKDVCKEQMPRCKFQSEMSEAVKAFLQKQNRRTDAL